MNASADFKDRLRDAGVRDDKPLHGILLTVHDAARAAEAAVRDGARGLSPEGELMLVERLSRSIGEGAAERVERLIERRTRRLGWRLGLIAAGMMLVGMSAAAGVGYWGGYRAGAAEVAGLDQALSELAESRPDEAKTWTALIRNNSITKALGRCDKASSFVVDGWRGCFPPLLTEWVGQGK